jgi:hypothetical protein
MSEDNKPVSPNEKSLPVAKVEAVKPSGKRPAKESELRAALEGKK